MPKVVLNGFPEGITEEDIKVSAFLSDEFGNAGANLVFQGQIIDGFMIYDLGEEYLGKRLTIVVIGSYYKYLNFNLNINQDIVYRTIPFEEDFVYVGNLHERPNKSRGYYKELYEISLEEMKSKLEYLKYTDDKVVNLFPYEVLILVLFLPLHEFIRVKYDLYLFNFQNIVAPNNTGTIATILAGLFGLLFTAYTFFRESLRKKANEEINGIDSKLQEIFFLNLLVLSLLTLSSLIMLYNKTGFGFLHWMVETSAFAPQYISFVLLLVIVYFMVELLDPNRLKYKIKGILFVSFFTLLIKYIWFYILTKVFHIFYMLFYRFLWTKCIKVICQLVIKLAKLSNELLKKAKKFIGDLYAKYKRRKKSKDISKKKKTKGKK